MKHILIIIAAISASLQTYASVEIENEFIERFEAFIEAGDFSEEKLKDIWMIQDTPPGLFSKTLDGLKELREQGIGESQFREIYPQMKARMSQPMELEGEVFVPYPSPYKMIEIKYSEQIPAENGSLTGWSYVLGLFEGKLYMMGLKVEPADVVNDEAAPHRD